MRLSQITLTGFRCFGNEPVTVTFDDLTTFVGANGTGKTAVLMALARMFGQTKSLRTVAKDDFHVGADSVGVTKLALRLEARFEFPELGDDAAAAASAAVPECLQHIVMRETGVPFCRVRLDATWQATASPDGDIEQTMWWIESTDDEPPEDALRPLHALERSVIQVAYVPAARDAVRELRAVSGSILASVFQRIAWSEAVKTKIAQLAVDMTTAVRSEPMLQSVEQELQEHWLTLRGRRGGSPTLSFADADLESILKRVDPRIDAGGSVSRPVEHLSEGERSLLYFALLHSVLAFEAKLAADGGAAESNPDAIAPALTIVAVEEPENHLAPQYLSRILGTLRAIR